MIMADDEVMVVLIEEDDSNNVEDSEILFEEIVSTDISEDGSREVTNRVDEVITTVVKEEDSSDDNFKEVVSTVDDNFNNLVDDEIIYDEYALTSEEDNSDNNVKEVVVTKTSEEDITEVSNTADVKMEVELIVDEGSNNSDNDDEVV